MKVLKSAECAAEVFNPMARSIKQNLTGVLGFVGLIWLIYLANQPLSLIVTNLNHWGLQPRTVSGLPGILTMPFLHRDLQHLLSNTVPLVVLMTMLRATRQNPWRITLALLLGSGCLLWCFGRSDIHVGSSVLIYSLAVYLITAGICERRPIPIIVSVLVSVLYGAFFWGLLPTAGSSVSWEGHLYGAFFGGLYAWLTLRAASASDTSGQTAISREPETTG